MWCKFDSLTPNRVMFGFNSQRPEVRIYDASGDMTARWNASGTNLIYRTGDTPLVTDTWLFIAVYWDTSQAQEAAIYVGDLDSPPTERSYALEVDHTGSLNSNSGVPLIVGSYTSGGSFSPDWTVGHLSYWSRRLSLGEMTSQWQCPHVASGCVLFSMYGYHGLNMIDLSGNRNTGTVSAGFPAPMVADHVPLGPVFGGDHEWFGHETFLGAEASVGPMVMNHFRRRRAG